MLMTDVGDQMRWWQVTLTTARIRPQHQISVANISFWCIRMLVTGAKVTEFIRGGRGNKMDVKVIFFCSIIDNNSMPVTNWGLIWRCWIINCHSAYFLQIRLNLRPKQSVKWGASSRWSFRPNSAWSSTETTTIGKTHPTFYSSSAIQQWKPVSTDLNSISNKVAYDRWILDR